MRKHIQTLRRMSKLQLVVCALFAFIALLAIATLSPGFSTMAAASMIPFAFGLMGATGGLEKSTKCTAAIATQFLIAKFGADDNTHSQAAAATDNLIGIFQHTTTNAGDEVRVMLDGISNLKLGGNVTRGGPITSDANAKGVAAVLGQNIIGFALASGVLNDIIPILIAPGILLSAGGVNGNTFKLVATAIFDATGGKATGAYALGVTIPDNGIIAKGFGDIITAFVSTGGTGTIKLGSEDQDDDLLAAVDADTLAGIFDLIPVGTVATMIKMTAARELVLTVGTAALTSGKAVFFVEYVISI